MKKLLKIVISIVAIVVVTVFAGGAILGLFIDPNEYKQEIEQAALDTADLELTINGDIGWSIYPSIGLNINDITAGYPGKDTLASLDSATISVLLSPLFSGELKMKTLKVKGLKLNLIQSATSSNWSVQTTAKESAKSTDKASSDNNTPPGKAPSDHAQYASKVDIESIIIENANITYSDTHKAEVTRIENFNLTTDRIQIGKAFNAQLSFALETAKQQQTTLSAKADLNANFLLDHLKHQYHIKDLKSQLTLTTDREISLALNSTIKADLAAQQIHISDLQVKMFDLIATGALQVKGEQLSDISGQLSVAKFDLKKLLQALKLPAISTADDASLRALSFSTDLSGTTSKLNFEQLKLAVDSTQISGSANYSVNSGLIGFNLKGNQITLDNYLPAATQAAPASGQTPTTNSAEPYSKEVIIPLEPLRALALKGKLTFDQINYQKTQVKKLNLAVDANQGLVKIPALNLQTYGANITNSVTLDARKQPLKLSLINTTKALQLGPVLKDYAESETLSGALTTSSRLSASGQSVHSIVNSLNGRVKLNLANGVIQGIDAVQTMCETINKVSSLGGAVSKTQSVDKSTPFASINGNLAFKNGVMSNQDFKADLDAINISGKGIVNLPKQALDYRVGLKIQENLFKKSCSVNNKIQGIEWPVDCKGRFSDDPVKLCKPDLSVVKDVLKKALKEKLQQKVEKKLGGSIKEKREELKEKVEEKVKDKLKDALKGLF